MNWKKYSILQQEKLQKEKIKLTYIVAFTHVNITSVHARALHGAFNISGGQRKSNTLLH
jgi:hypothetical protein